MSLTRVPLGLVVAGAGVLLVVIGLLVWAGAFNWFGRLPGDIRVERPGVRFHFPLVSMLIVSITAALRARGQQARAKNQDAGHDHGDR